MAIGVWRSLVSRLVRVQEASGSNPDTPTKKESSPKGELSFLYEMVDEPEASCISIHGLGNKVRSTAGSLGFESRHSAPDRKIVD